MLYAANMLLLFIIQNYTNTSELMNITFIWGRCDCSLAAVKLNEDECDLNDGHHMDWPVERLFNSVFELAI